MRMIPFEPDHIASLADFGGQEHLVETVRPQDLADMRDRGIAYSAVYGDHVVGCAGLVGLNAYRAVCWGIFARAGGHAFLGIHRATRHVMVASGYRRIEAYVDPMRPDAMRWIKMLGFRLDLAWIPYFFPDGSGASLWSYYPE